MGYFGFSPPGTRNNAPPPVPITGSTGANTGQTPTTPSANNNPFAINTPGGAGIQSLSSGLPFTAGTGAGSGDQFYKSLSNAFGSGTAGLLWNVLQGGLFNPQVASAYLGAMQPGINQGEASINQAFGAEGSRFGSAEALGLGNYLSQVNLNEQQTLAVLFQSSQQEEVSLLNNILPTLHDEKANSGGLLSDILGGLEAAGGIALTAASGGALA